MGITPRTSGGRIAAAVFTGLLTGLLALFHPGQSSAEEVAGASELKQIGEAYGRHYRAVRSLRVVYEEVTSPLIGRQVLWDHARQCSFLPRTVKVVIQGEKVFHDLAMETKSPAGVITLLRKEDPERFKDVQGDLGRLVTYAEIERLLPEVVPKPYATTIVYDGSKLRRKSAHSLWVADTEIPTYSVEETVKQTYPRFRWLYPHLALYAPMTPGLPKDNELSQDSRIPELLERPGTSVSVAQERFKETDCVVLDVAGRQKLWLDPQRGYAVRRRQVKIDGQPRMEIEFDDLVEVTSGVWLPMTVTKTDLGGPIMPKEHQGKPYLKTTLRVSILEVNDPKHAAFFDFEPTAGAIVFDKTLRPTDSQGEPIDKPLAEGLVPNVNYVQPADAADVEKVVKQAQRQQGKSIEAQEPARWGLGHTVFVVLSACFLVAAVTFFVSRKVRT